MESYIDLTLKSSQRISQLEDAFEKIREFDIEGLKKALQFFSPVSQDAFDCILEDYAECLEGLEEFYIEDEILKANFVCGGDGLDFLFQLFLMFGPGVDDIRASFDHDEEKDESDVYDIAHIDGKLYINEREVYSSADDDRNVFDYLREEFLGILSEYSKYVLLITDTPDGEAPEWVRDQWVGLEIPLTVGSVSNAWELEGGAEGVLSGELSASDFDSPIVMALDAFNVLKEKSQDAWAWWSENCPDLFDPDAGFLFNSGSWELKEKQ